jgi:hypothetical protein
MDHHYFEGIDVLRKIGVNFVGIDFDVSTGTVVRLVKLWALKQLSHFFSKHLFRDTRAVAGRALRKIWPCRRDPNLNSLYPH